MKATLVRTLLFISLFAFVACERGTAKKQDLALDAPVMAYLPKATGAFGVFYAGDDGYKEFLDSRWGKAMMAASSAQLDYVDPASQDLETKVMLKIVEFYRLIGLLTPDGKIDISWVNSYQASLATTADGKTPAIGLVAELASKDAARTRYERLRDGLKDVTGFPTQPENFDGSAGFTLKLQFETFPEIFKTIFFGQRDEFLFVSTDREAVAKGIRGEKSEGLKELKERPEFGNISKNAAVGANVGFAFFDLLKSFELARYFQPEGFGPDAQKFLNAVDGLVMRQNATATNVEFEVAAAGLTFEEPAKGIFGRLADVPAPKALHRLPANIAMATSVRGEIYAEVKKLWAGQPMPPELQAHLDAFEKVEEYTIAIRHNDAGSPIPETFFVLSTATPDPVITSIRKAAELVSEYNPQITIQWQEKEISGVKVSYLLMPLGAGIFVGKAPDNSAVLVGTSERVFRTMVAAWTGAEASVGSGQPSLVKSSLDQSKVALSWYLNFASLSEILEAFGGNMALVAGQVPELKNIFNQPTFKGALREYGYMTGGLSSANGRLAMLAHMFPPVTK